MPVLSFPHAFGAVPEPEAGDGKNEQRQAHEGGVAELEPAVGDAQQPVDDGAVVEVFDEIGPALLYEQQLPGGAVELQGGVMIGKRELDHAFVGAHIDAVELEGEPCGDGVAQQAHGLAVEAVEGQPIGQFGGGAALGFG